MADLYVAIMAGGAGTRFWPASRRDRPKQLLTLFGPQTLLAAAVARVQPMVPPERSGKWPFEARTWWASRRRHGSS